MKLKRVVIIVLDSLGVGALPDAGEYGDEGSNTLARVLEAASRGGKALELRNLEAFGLGLIEGVTGLRAAADPLASYGRMAELSAAKDTTTGHLELCGLVTHSPPPTFPGGFPPEILARFTRETGYGWLWGKPASGTEIIAKFGAEHMESRKLIVYTSADSVFQIAAHEDIVPVEELYRVCARSRAFLNDYKVGRVIARPFIGSDGNFSRTSRRRDFSLPPSGETVLDSLKSSGAAVTGIGKIGDIFARRGLTTEIKSAGNADGMAKTLKSVELQKEGLIFTNLIDFDMLYGHRRDARGYGLAMTAFDTFLPELRAKITKEDMLIITADHGCDPAFSGTDHTREYVPLLVYTGGGGAGCSLGTRGSFSDVAATISDIFGLGYTCAGTSFLGELHR